MKFWNLGIKAILLLIGAVLIAPTSAHAIPAFARKYGVKCYTCHTVRPGAEQKRVHVQASRLSHASG